MAEAAEKKRDRSPSFPYITLTVSLDRIKALHESARNNSVMLSDAASDWGLSPSSSSTLRNAAALGAYGLLADEGTGIEKRVRLTENATRIIGDTRPGVREQLLANAALSPNLIREYYQLWGRERPNDAHAISTLVYDSNFTDRAAKTFLNVYDDAISYIGDAEQPGIAEKSADFDDGSLDTSHTQAQEIPPYSSGEARSEDDSGETSVDGFALLRTAKTEEWLSLKVSKDTSVKILVEGDLDARKLEKLIKVLSAQKEIMDDDY